MAYSSLSIVGGLQNKWSLNGWQFDNAPQSFVIPLIKRKIVFWFTSALSLLLTVVLITSFYHQFSYGCHHVYLQRLLRAETVSHLCLSVRHGVRHTRGWWHSHYGEGAPIILIICDVSAMCYAWHLFDFNTINFPVVNKLVRTVRTVRTCVFF